MNEKSQVYKKGGTLKGLVFFVGILLLVLTSFFHASLDPSQFLFANDGPLGISYSEAMRSPAVFSGVWADLNWLGFGSSGIALGLSGLVQIPFSPETVHKIYVPFSLFLVGLSSWLFFRQLGFGMMVCVLGGLAGALNMRFFSVACWGLGTWNVAIASFFLALAALVTPAIRQMWVKAALAGLAIGMAVIEAADTGAILSVFFGIFVVFVAFAGENGSGNKILKSIWVPVLVVLFAFWIAIHSVAGLIGTQIQGIVGTGQSKEDKAARWDFCTQWSLPKLEAFRLIIPGAFGYRMQEYIDGDDKSSAYWGRVAEDPRISLIEQTESNDSEVRRKASRALGLPPQAEDALAGADPGPRTQVVEALKQYEGGMTRRHSGSGEYAGILVAVLALFGLANAFRGKNSAFSVTERRIVFFWAIVAFISLLLAFGRHGFLYQYFFQLPYASTIRNTLKFLFPVHIALIILAGFGLESLNRQYLQKVSTRTGGLVNHLKLWWARVSGFEKKWALGSIFVVGVVIFTTLILLSSRADLEGYLLRHGFTATLAPQIASFFYGELFWFIGFLVVSLGAVICILSGAWNARRAWFAAVLLGVIMVLDLGHADLPWIRYYDFTKRYVSNPVIDFLKEKPYEHRVTAELMPMSHKMMAKEPNFFGAYYDMLQNQIPYWNIQSLDIIQMPRVPEFDERYIKTFQPKDQDLFPCLRLWQLTNTRYILGSTDNPYGLKFSPQEGFVPRLSFDVTVKPWLKQALLVEDLTYVQTTNGPLEIFEFTNALPRVKLYSQWQSTTNDQETLDKLVSRNFNPEKTVLVAAETPVSPSVTPDSDPGSVKIVSYHPKSIVLNATAKTPSVLLINDKFSTDWKVSVDGKPANVLRCNYIMRGVHLEPGEHQIEFRFKPKMTTFYVSLGAWGVGILIAGYAFITNRKRSGAEEKKDEK